MKRGQHGVVYRVVDEGEGSNDFARKVRERILTAQPNEVNALAQLSAKRQVIAPRTIDAGECHCSLGIDDRVVADCARQRLATGRLRLPHLGHIVAQQNRTAPLDHEIMLLLDDSRVARECAPDLDVLTFDDSLCTRDFASDDRIVHPRFGLLVQVSRRDQALDVVADEEIVLEADEES